MSNRLNLLLGVHNHQPVDNWESVMQEATERCYQPFLDVLEAHPGVAMSIHYTGYLLDWLIEKHPALITQLQRLVYKGQVELFTGGYYEPVLAIIPDQDKVDQIQRLSRRIEGLTGKKPRGLWLAERVWEPHLVKALAEAGVSYLCVDDAHFKSVGLDEPELMGRYTSEEQGHCVDIFPVSKDLRYKIPYADPHAVVDAMIEMASPDGRRAAIYFDDGEKFGVWPGTYQSVYRERWLDRFFSAIEARADVIQPVTFSQYVEQTPSLGRIYLPTASYSEMLEWSLPAKYINTFEQALQDVPEAYQRYIRGGFWRHFLVKYPEANQLHKKMLYVAGKVRQAEATLRARGEGAQADAMLDALWKGQSNDVFWHGVFGGLYLTNLRSANYQHLIAAERVADQVNRGPSYFSRETRDIDCDGAPEVLLETPTQALYFDPAEGGTLFEWDYRPKNFHLTDSLARRYEAYHDKLAHAVFDDGQNSGDEGPKTIHERVVTKERGLEKLLHYDWHRRTSLLDHFFGDATTLESLFEARYPEQGDFVNQPYTAVEQQPDGITLRRLGTVWEGSVGHPIEVTKTVTVDAQQANNTVVYTLTNRGQTTANLWFSPEFNINLLAPDAPDRYYVTNYAKDRDTAGLGSGQQGLTSGGGTALAEAPPVALALKSVGRLHTSGQTPQAAQFGLVDEWLGVSVLLTFDRPTDVWRFPVETISQSEAGFEKVYQSSALYPHWRLSLAPGESQQRTIQFSVIPK
jgi:alpha-amylase